MNAASIVELAWLDDAPCKGLDPGLFFADGPGATYREAREVCGACPFSGLDGPCITYAARVLDGASWSDLGGMFGGFTPQDRRSRKMRAFRRDVRGESDERGPCGSNAAYSRHRYRGEPIDEACREAHRLYEAGRAGRLAALHPPAPRERPPRCGEDGGTSLAMRARAVGV